MRSAKPEKDTGMNNKFFNLTKEKQRTIIDAGFRIFSQNSYKKTPVSEIAAEADISKSLLFHYFHNKKELYLFLWEYAAQLSLKALTTRKCYEPGNLFDRMELGMEEKFKLIHKYPYMTSFVVRAYYETNPEVRSALQSSFHRLFDQKKAQALAPEEMELDFRDMLSFWRETYENPDNKKNSKENPL